MEEYLQEALEIAKAQASVRNMTEDEISSMVATVAKKVKEISEESGQQQQEQPEQEEQQQEPPVDPKKSVREKSVVCLECGKTFKVLSKKHLEKHGITPQEYKEKWGLKKNQALIAKSLARERRKKMEEMQLWKKRKNIKQTG